MHIDSLFIQVFAIFESKLHLSCFFTFKYIHFFPEDKAILLDNHNY